MAPSPLAKKLHIKPGQRIILINPPAGYTEQLGKLPDGAELAKRATGQFDFVHLFAKDSAEVSRFGPKALQVLNYDGVFWVSYPKKSSGVASDISRDHGWDLLKESGLRPVSAVSIDDTWSALRFRPVAAVGK